MLHNREGLHSLMDRFGLEDVPLEAGMTINLEASYHEFGWGTVDVEYTLAVTDKGSEYLSSPGQQKLHLLPLA